MALTTATLDQLTRDGYGPLEFVRRDDGVDTHWNGHVITVRPEPSTVCVAAQRAVGWPSTQGIAPAEVDERVRRVLDEIVVERGGLLRVDADAERSAVTVARWLDADSSGPADLAAAIREVDTVVTVAEWAIELVDARLDVEAQVVELAEASERDLEAASRAVSATPSIEDAAALASVAGPPTASPTGPPSASSESVASEPSRLEAEATPWCYVSSAVDVFDPSDPNRVASQLQPGVWYVLLDRQGEWSRVADQGRTIEGWVASDSVRLRDS